MSEEEIVAESQQYHNSLIQKNVKAPKKLTYRNWVLKNRPKFITQNNRQIKICAILLILLLLTPLLYKFLIPDEETSPLIEIERNENPDSFIVPDDTIAFTAKEALNPKKHTKIAGTRGYIGTSPPVGDWIITGEAMVWNETIILNGNLTVTETGNLTLINVTLIINCNYNGEFHIEILGGGGLYIYDFDWNQFTEGDASNITAMNPSYKYLFWVGKDTYFEMRNSKLSWCGYSTGTNNKYGGVRINTDNTIIEGNLITNTANGLIFWESNSNIVELNTIKDTYSGQGIYMKNSLYNFLSRNTIYNNVGSGIYLTSSSNNNISKNYIHSNKIEGIYLLSSSNENNITENVIFDIAIHGIVLLSSSKNFVSKNTIHNNLAQGIYLEGAQYNNISKNEIFNNSHSGIYLTSSKYNIISNNTIYANEVEGILLISSSNENNIIDNIAFDNSIHGILLSDSSNNHLLRNIIHHNKVQGINSISSFYNNISANTIYNNSHSGIYLKSSSKNTISNNILYSNKIEGILLISSSNENNITNNVAYNNSIHGILLSSSLKNFLLGNTIFNNSLQGVFFDSSSHNNYLSSSNIFNNSQYGIYIRSSSNNIMNNCIVSYNRYGDIYLTSSSNHNLISNSSIYNSYVYDFRLTSNSHLIALNTSFNRTNIKFDDTRSTLTVQWYLHVKVTNPAEIPIINATVRVKENINGSYDKNFTTNLKGFVKWIITTEYIQDSSSITYFTPHIITAIFKKYKDYATPRMDESKTIIMVLHVPGNYTILYPGWNLISIPYIQSNVSIEQVLQPMEGHYDAVQWYNSTNILNHWEHYHISKPSHLNDLKELNHKIGFWIRITSPKGVSLLWNGTIPTTDQTITLYPGWNLVGYPSIVPRLRGDALNNLKFGNDVQIIYYYDAKTRSWDTLETDERMKKGVGYWFYTSSNLVWIVNSTIPPIHNLNKDFYYNTIQDGINFADENDILEIADSIFYENVRINKSITLIGNDINHTIIIGGFNITSNNVTLSYLSIRNSSYGIISDGVNEIDVTDVLIYNCTNGLIISNSTNISIESLKTQNVSYSVNLNSSRYISFLNILISSSQYGFSSNNSYYVSIINSTIEDCEFLTFLLLNSNITILNSTLNTSQANFLNENSNLIAQWYLHVYTKDQMNYPINGATIRVTDNENGTYNETFITNYDGITNWIIITERIQNLTGNISFTPYNISVSHPEFSFIEDFYELIIYKSTTVTFISVNTVLATSIYNVNRNRYYITIQDAIEDTNPYDTIRISTGTYFENIDINKPLNLSGEDKFSTVIDGRGEINFNITSDDVTLYNLNIQNYTNGVCIDSIEGLTILDTIIANNTIGIYCIKSSLMITNSILQNNTLEFLISDSHLTTLNTHFNSTQIIFLDPLSTLTVKWYFHVRVQDGNGYGIIGANVWIVDNENGTFDQNFTTGSDGYVWYIILTERIQNQGGNISFNPYWINVSYYDTEYGYGWLTFTDNPRNISLNGSLFEISKEIFQSLKTIPEFSHILIPIIAITASFVLFRKKNKNTQ